jgi:O-antigen ligase
MFLEKPLTGWGPAKNKYVLGSRLPWQGRPRRDTHNIVLEILTATGIVGAIPFLIGLGICVRAAWQARKGTEGILPFAMLSAILVGNMSGNYIAAKLFWFVLAYAAASRYLRGSTEAMGGSIPTLSAPSAQTSYPFAAARSSGRQGGTA